MVHDLFVASCVLLLRTRVIAANETTMVRSCTTPTTSGSLSFSSVRSATNLRRAILVEHKWKEKMLILWSGSDGLHTASGLALNGGRLDEVPGEVLRIEDVWEWLLCWNNCHFLLRYFSMCRVAFTNHACRCETPEERLWKGLRRRETSWFRHSR